MLQQRYSLNLHAHFCMAFMRACTDQLGLSILMCQIFMKHHANFHKKLTSIGQVNSLSRQNGAIKVKIAKIARMEM